MSEATVRPNQQLIYVSDIAKSTDFYKKLFQYDPMLASPRYVVFGLDGKSNFALWSGAIAH
jgi:predicted enzyme related to lactoylglutathione lyase